MNVAIIIAGGVGSRTGNRIPKQFINVNDKPIIIYTLEQFQKHKNIDAIEVVCLDGWHDILRAYAEQYGIAKLKYIISGGTSSQESIKIGLENLKGKLNKDDVVVIHDGIRPMVDADIISSCIDTCVENGNRYGRILDIYNYGFENNIGIHASSYANTLMADVGEKLYFSEGSTKNIKITTKDDIAIFKAMIDMQKA